MSELKSAQLLEQEHEVIHHVIAALPAIADRIEESERADTALTSAVREFLEHYADGMHHAKEERFLFPLLERRGVPSGGCPLAALRREHEAGRMLVSELTVVPTSGTSTGQLIAALRRIAKLYVEHMWKEDYLLIPMAGKLLSAADDDELVRGFGSVDAAFGKVERERFEQFARGLQQQAIEYEGEAINMPEQGTIHSPTPRPKTTSGPFLSFNLNDEIEKLRSEDTWQAGKNSKTLIKYSDYRIVLIALHKGARMTEHHAAGRISVHTVSGRIKVHIAGSEFDMPAGRLLVLDRALSHDVEAVEESAFVVTIAWPEQKLE